MDQPKPLRTLSYARRAQVQSNLQHRVNTVLSALNLTFRLTYRQAMERTTGMPLEAVEKLRAIDRLTDCRLVAARARYEYFRCDRLDFCILFDRQHSDYGNSGTQFMWPELENEEVLVDNPRILNVMRAYKDVRDLLRMTRNLSVNLLYSLNPVLHEMLDGLLDEHTFAPGRDIAVPSDMTPVYYAMRRHTTTFREIMIAPKAYQQPVPVDGFARSLHV